MARQAGYAKFTHRTQVMVSPALVTAIKRAVDLRSKGAGRRIQVSEIVREAWARGVQSLDRDGVKMIERHPESGDCYVQAAIAPDLWEALQKHMPVDGERLRQAPTLREAMQRGLAEIFADSSSGESSGLCRCGGYPDPHHYGTIDCLVA